MLGSHPLRSPGLPIKHGHSGVQKPHFLQTSAAGLKWGAAGHPAKTPPRGRERFYPLSCGARGVQPAQDPGICSLAVRLCEKRAGPRGAHPGGGGPRRERARCGGRGETRESASPMVSCAAFRLRSRRGKAAPRGVGKAPADAGPRGRTDGPSTESPGPGRTRLLRTPRVAAAVGKDAPESGRKPWTASGRRARRPPTVRRRVACRKRHLPEASPAGSGREEVSAAVTATAESNKATI